MRRLPALAALLLFAVPAAAAPTADPLRFIPGKADLVIKVENPRKLFETVAGFDAVKQARQLEVLRPFLDTAQVRRAFDFVAYAERELGAPWPELLDRLAGGGIAAGTKVGDGDDPVLFVVQATDEKLLAKFVEKAVAIIEDELARAESKEKVARESYQGFETLRLGKDFHACRIGSALLLANRVEALRGGIDQHLENTSKGGKPAKNFLTAGGPGKAKKLLPPEPLAWVWYGLDYLKAKPEAKDLLSTPRDNTILTFLFAGYLDVARRSDFICAGVYGGGEGLGLSIRMPAGREGMAEDVELHLPRDAKTAGTLPLLEPKGVIFSHSFYLDLGVLWEKRDKVINAANVKGFEDGVKQGSRFLPGTSIDKLLTQSGTYHRLVAANRTGSLYKVEPQLRLPAFAYVVSMRDPAFGKSAEALIRAGGLLASTQVSLKMFEEKHGDVKLFGYRFPEDGKFPADDQNLRFNFMPTFAAVKDQFIAASTPELCKEIIDLVAKEDRTAKISQNMRMRVYAAGGGDFLNSSPEQLLTQTILSQAINEAQAKKQVDQVLQFARTLGTLNIETDYTAKEFRFDLRWKLNK
jgi:hypothetical protein